MGFIRKPAKRLWRRLMTVPIRHSDGSYWNLNQDLFRLVVRPARRLLRRHADRRVDFLICGVQKSATSAMDEVLRRHPQVRMADQKEVHYFDDDANFQSAKPDYSLYHAAFSATSHCKALGESTPTYMFWRAAPERIFRYNEQIKLIAVLRNPIDRAYSQWNMQRARGIERLTFWEALQAEPERTRRCHPHQNRSFSYVERGLYVEQIQRLWSFFPSRQTLFLRHEELSKRPDETLEQVCRFLGLSLPGNLGFRRVHARAYTSSITERERDYLRSIFGKEVDSLARLLGWNCSNWLDTPGSA